MATLIVSGDEWDYVIMSTVRSMPRHEIDKRPTFGWLKMNLGFIMDQNQINVALTRAKKGSLLASTSLSFATFSRQLAS